MRKALLLWLVLAGMLATAQSTPTVSKVQNAADFSSRLSPGLEAVIFGSNFGSGNASVTVGGKSAYVALVGANSIVVQLPVEASTGINNLVVSVAGVASTPFPIAFETYAPALFSNSGVFTGMGFSVVSGNAIRPVSSVMPARSGDQITVYATGLGPTNPATPTGLAPPVLSRTVASVNVTVGGQPATVLFAGAAAGTLGTYQINFTVPLGLQGTQPVTVSVDGVSSNPANLPLFGINSIVSNASFGSAGTVAPGSIVSVFANGIGSTAQIVGFPATTFLGVSVLFNGTPAPIFHLTGTQGQIDLLVPYELPTSGTVTVQLKTASGTTESFSVAMAPAIPSMYFLADPVTKGRTNVLAQFNNTAWLAMPDSLAAALKIPGNCAASNLSPSSLCGYPATPGDYLVLYATGLGKATVNGDSNGAELKTGEIPPANGSVLYRTVSTPAVTVGGLAATVVFSGIAPGFPGLYQIDLQVPAGLAGDDIPVTISVGDSSRDTRTVAIRQK